MKETDSQVFESLSKFLLTMIYETDYFVEVEKTLIVPGEGTAKLYALSEQKDIMQGQDGLYSSVALIINFFLSYPKKIGLQ